MGTFLRKNLKLISGYTQLDARRDALRRAEEYLAGHREIIAPYLSRTFKFTEVEDAFALAIVPNVGQLKVTLQA
jgi:hypothetical protein